MGVLTRGGNAVKSLQNQSRRRRAICHAHRDRPHALLVTAARTLPGLVAAAHQAALGANCIATPFMLRPPAHTTVNTSTP